MIVDLNKIDLIALVRGTSPDYDLFNKLKEYGQYFDVTGWRWKMDTLKKLSEQQLYDLYLLIQYPDL
jgi:hypothetical protein